MSTIGLTAHNEDIHNIIKKPMTPVVKSPRYKSKWSKWASCQGSLHDKNKYNGHQTFGLAHYEAPDFKDFLKKGKLTAVAPAVKHINRKEFKCTVNCKNVPLPKPNYERRKQIKKNFVKENIKKVLTLTPKVPVPRRVETPRGTAKDLAHLLQMIKIRESENYGQIPKYLCDRKIQLEKERQNRELQEQAIREYKEKMGIGLVGMDENVSMIDEETRKKILDGLKENWNELSKQFLKLPVMTDTWPKIKRKMALEHEITQLEKDIKLVETHPYIYLERTDRRPLAEIIASQTRMQQEQENVKEEGKEVKEAEPEAEAEPEPEPEREEEKELDAKESVAEKTADDKREEDREINVYNYCN